MTKYKAIELAAKKAAESMKDIKEAMKVDLDNMYHTGNKDNFCPPKTFDELVDASPIKEKIKNRTPEEKEKLQENIEKSKNIIAHNFKSEFMNILRAEGIIGKIVARNMKKETEKETISNYFQLLNEEGKSNKEIEFKEKLKMFGERYKDFLLEKI